jgi:hypothetical protein
VTIPDPAAVLEEMQSRHYRIPDPSVPAAWICQSDRHRWPCHAHVALAALEAVLKVADEAEPVDIAVCTCRDCEASGEPGYEDYEPHPGRAFSWDLDPARIREAITRELSGEESGDGS